MIMMIQYAMGVFSLYNASYKCCTVVIVMYINIFLSERKKIKVIYILNTNERVLITVYESLLSSITLWYEGIDTLIMVFKTKTNKQHTDPAYLPFWSRSIYLSTLNVINFKNAICAYVDLFKMNLAYKFVFQRLFVFPLKIHKVFKIKYHFTRDV